MPSKEKVDLLGVLFDSAIHPSPQTQMSFLFKGVSLLKQELYEEISHALKTHLQICNAPSVFCPKYLPKAIPRYKMGHIENIESIQRILEKKCPSFYLLGNYLQGVSVNDCIRLSKQLVEDRL